MIVYEYNSDGDLHGFTIDDQWDDYDEIPGWVDTGSPVRYFEETS